MEEECLGVFKRRVGDESSREISLRKNPPNVGGERF